VFDRWLKQMTDVTGQLFGEFSSLAAR